MPICVWKWAYARLINEGLCVHVLLWLCRAQPLGFACWQILLQSYHLSHLNRGFYKGTAVLHHQFGQSQEICLKVISQEDTQKCSWTSDEEKYFSQLSVLENVTAINLSSQSKQLKTLHASHLAIYPLARVHTPHRNHLLITKNVYHTDEAASEAIWHQYFWIFQLKTGKTLVINQKP